MVDGEGRECVANAGWMDGWMVYALSLYIPIPLGTAYNKKD